MYNLQNIDVDFLKNELDKYIMSTDQLVLTGDIIQNKWNLKGKQIGDLKNLLLEQIFCKNLNNNIEELINFQNKKIYNYKNI
jgi:hypothetical protein